MEFKASHNYVRMSARKARLVIDMVRGLPVNAALEALQTTHRRAGMFIRKVLKSAVSNAEQLQAMAAKDLYVKTAVINEGPLLMGRLRWKAGPQGRMRPIRKRTCHIHVTLGVVEGDKTSRRDARKAGTTNKNDNAKND